MVRNRWLFFSSLFLAIGLLMAPGQIRGASLPQVMIILDGSGSMWGKVKGQVKIDGAKQVFAKVLPSIAPDAEVGLTLYGHRRKGDCADIEVVGAPGKLPRESLLQAVQSLQPKGMTPIAKSLQLTADLLKSHEAETTIVLISDGEETCHDDPCAAVKALKSTGIKFILHVIGFGVDDKQRTQLTCLAQAGGGRYFSADDVEGLLSAMETVKVEVAQKVEQAKTVTQKARTGLGKLRISMPPSAAVSLGEIVLQRVSDGYRIKSVKSPEADTLHPLPAGTYEVILGFANPNYKPPTEVTAGRFDVTGGETTHVSLGALAFNIAESLHKIPVNAVQLKGMEGQFSLELLYHGNAYYFFKPKPLPAGSYDFSVTYSNSPASSIIARGIPVNAGKESVITLDSGIQLLKPAGQSVSGWNLKASGDKVPLLMIKRRWDNEHPLWEPFAVPPGKYSLEVLMKGMKEPLPVADEIAISAGQLLQFDTGL